MGDTTKAMLPRFCRIFVGLDVEATVVPATVDTAFDSTWDELGLLAKGGPSENNTWGQNTKLYARNGELVRRYEDEFSAMVDFSVHEWNSATREVMWPGSTEDKLYVPRSVPMMLAFEYQEDDVIERYITALHAKVMRNGATTRAENALVAYPLQAEIFPDLEDVNDAGEPCLWLRQSTNDESS